MGNIRVATCASRTKGKTMTAKKRSNKAGTPTKAKGKREIQVHTLSLTPEMVMGGLRRFGTVCDFVESQMRKEQSGDVAECSFSKARSSVGGAAVPSAPKSPTPEPIPSVEMSAADMRALAKDVASLAEAIWLRLNGGSSVEAVNGGVGPTLGPIKDSISITIQSLLSIRQDLDAINQYTMG
jgi:hypothetical protein